MATAQSPYLSILVKMDSIKAEGTRYKIEMKICEPKKMSQRGSWFTHDTSKINFASLNPDDIFCGEYFSEINPDLMPGQLKDAPFNEFNYSNQFFAWEKIFVFKISDWSSRGWHPEMYIVMPIKYKSFRTSIDLTGIKFQSGKVMFLTALNGVYEENGLSFIYSLKNEKGTEVKDSPFKDNLEGK